MIYGCYQTKQWEWFGIRAAAVFLTSYASSPFTVTVSSSANVKSY